MFVQYKHVLCVSLPLILFRGLLGELKGNIAKGKPAYQVSTWSIHNASMAVDGNRNTSRYDNTCTFTAEKTPNPWWYVDLERDYPIRAVEIVNRDSYGYRLANFKIIVTKSKPPDGFASGHVCYEQVEGAKDGEVITKLCNNTIGRYVGIQITTGEMYLTLCEVEVDVNDMTADHYQQIRPAEDLNLMLLAKTVSPKTTLIGCALQCHSLRGNKSCSHYHYDHKSKECRLFVETNSQKDIVPNDLYGPIAV